MRRAVATALAVAGLLSGLAGCTTSRAVRAWHAAEKARASGDRELALRRYDEAYGRDGRLVGAEVDRIGLLAGDVGAASAVEAARAALAEKKSGYVEVQLLAAGLELVAGRVAPALAQLERISETALDKAEAALGHKGLACGPLRRERWRLLALAALHADRPGVADKATAALAAKCAPLRPAEADLVAIVALRRGDLGAADQAGAASPTVRAALALRARDHARALALLGERSDGPSLVLRAQAALGIGDVARAGRAIAAARDAGVATSRLVPLEGALALLQGDARRGRDLLAGAVAQSGVPSWTMLFDLGLCELGLGNLAAARDAFARAATACRDCAPARRNRDAIDRALGRLP